MERGEGVNKKNKLNRLPKWLLGFLDKTFDWIVLIFITLLILFILFYFHA